ITPPLRQYTKRTRIAQSLVLPPVADEPASSLGDDSQESSCWRIKIEGSDESGDDAPIKGRRLDEGEEAAERASDDTEEMATVLTSMDAASILTSGGVQVVPTTAEVATATVSIPTGSGVVSTASPTIPTAALIFTTATEFTPYTRRKGVKKIKTSEEVLEEVKSSEEVPEEKLKEMMQLIPVEEIYVEALQVKYPIIDWKVHTEGQRSYWKITRLGGNSASYQFFVDMLKHLDREDLNQLWRLVKESLSIRQATSDKEMELWVELQRLYEPDAKDQLWTHTQNMMHAPVEWKLYDTCGVHHVTSKDKEIFMLVEKDYPLKKGLAIVMISYKLQVENYSQMASDLILKIHKIANCPRQEDD
nr:hypothetical protein [Tanacetum cinerariifolium]